MAKKWWSPQFPGEKGVGGQTPFQPPGQVLMHRGTTALHGGRGMTTMTLGPNPISLRLGRRGRVRAHGQEDPCAWRPVRGCKGHDRGGRGRLRPWETQTIPRWSQVCVGIAHPTPHTIPLDPGLTPLQTWPLPAPQCDPGSCWQLCGAGGAERGRWGPCAGKMGDTGVSEQGDTQTTPFYT